MMWSKFKVKQRNPLCILRLGSTVLNCLLLLLVCGSLSAHKLNDAEQIDQVMRGIGIHYLISDDRKLPKRDRKKWEADLGNYIDFNALNEGMRNRIKAAIAESDPTAMDDETTAQLSEKAVLFLIPRHLADYTRAYLKKKHELGALVPCDATVVAGKDDYTLCMSSISATEKHAVFVNDAGKEMITLEFKQQGNWKLVNIDSEINEKTLLTIAMWK